MRLTPTERTTLTRAARSCFRDDAVLRLFGSRVDDDALGGDIDLLVQTTMTDALEIAKAHILFLAQVYQSLGQQKIDLLIDYPSKKQRPIIFDIAKNQGVLL
jgi:predicted nucleotidyltransferase